MYSITFTFFLFWTIWLRVLLTSYFHFFINYAWIIVKIIFFQPTFRLWDKSKKITFSFNPYWFCDYIIHNTKIYSFPFCSPHDTPFEDGTFKLTLEFTEEYPNKPPTVRFVSKMFHPNGKCGPPRLPWLLVSMPARAVCLFSVYADGSICLDILQNRWSPTYDVSAILTSIQVRYLFLSDM